MANVKDSVDEPINYEIFGVSENDKATEPRQNPSQLQKIAPGPSPEDTGLSSLQMLMNAPPKSINLQTAEGPMKTNYLKNLINIKMQSKLTRDLKMEYKSRKNIKYDDSDS